MNRQNFRRRSASRPGTIVRYSGKGRAKRGSSGNSIDPARLVKKAIPIEEKSYTPGRTFEEMPLNGSLKSALQKKGYVIPTEIQDKTLEFILEGRDVLGLAKTGTGKTAAFLIPLINRLVESDRPFQTMIVVPTRELAEQVEEEFKSLTRGLNLYSTCFIGGTSVGRDMQKLKKFSHIVVGTPGRLIDLMNRNALKLKNFKVLVLDEFDRMLDMGFSDDVKKLTTAMEQREQTLLFSATKDQSQQSLINKLLNSPEEVKVSNTDLTGDHIEQDIIRIKSGEDKLEVLLGMLNDREFGKVLLFAETKRTVDQIHGRLRKSGIRAEQIHGDKTQGYRKKALDKFKSGNVQVLVATDVAARGLDVSDVTHVINYQMPQNFENYVHRIGRTGRAGKGGKAFTFVN